ncbi:MAG: hypothetical protein LH606_21910 [Cytophagaceae bacterium]|nr:hypothetical protein [Cytophagaceae bacterium]
MTQNELRYGFAEPLPTARTLRVGPLTMLYESGFLRYIRWGEHELIRMIYFTVRDENWGTPQPILTDERIECDGEPAPDQEELTGKTITISYALHYENRQGRLFEWRAQIEILDSGEINFEIDGTALQTLRKNRAGFCVLHPIAGTAGQPVELIHEDGSQEESRFPDVISPQNPFKRLRALRWQNATGYWFKVNFEGELFETEDQRNWTDASYKTFCTPLDIPFPVELKAGENVWQRITFRPEDELPPLPLLTNSFVEIWAEETRQTQLPELGFSASTETKSLQDEAVAFLRNLRLNFYQIEIQPGQTNWIRDFQQDLTNAQALNLPVAVILLLTNHLDVELETFVGELESLNVVLHSVLLLSSDGAVTSALILEKAVPWLRRALPGVPIGAGTYFNFTELNRNRFDPASVDFVSYTIQPQEHAFDHRSLVENTAAQADTVASTRSFYGEVPVQISSVTLRKRSNPTATDSVQRLRDNERKADPRQPSLWAAGWTLSSLKHLAEAGAATVAYYQTVGRQGICDLGGWPYPLAMLLGEVQKLQGGQVIRTETSEPLACGSLLIENGAERRWFLANHTAQPLVVRLPGEVPTAVWKLTTFPAKRIAESLSQTNEIILEPFGVYVIA